VDWGEDIHRAIPLAEFSAYPRAECAGHDSARRRPWDWESPDLERLSGTLTPGIDRRGSKIPLTRDVTCRRSDLDQPAAPLDLDLEPRIDRPQQLHRRLPRWRYPPALEPCDFRLAHPRQRRHLPLREPELAAQPAEDARKLAARSQPRLRLLAFCYSRLPGQLSSSRRPAPTLVSSGWRTVRCIGHSIYAIGITASPGDDRASRAVLDRLRNRANRPAQVCRCDSLRTHFRTSQSLPSLAKLLLFRWAGQGSNLRPWD
jgi:hypothetical protein